MILVPMILSLGWIQPAWGALYEEPCYWPPKIKLVRAFDLPESKNSLPAGRHGVLIRIEKKADDSDVLIVDFGSEGVHALRPDVTDIRSRAQAYKIGLESKSYPNWTMMIGRAFLRISADEAAPIQLKEIAQYEKMLIVYDDKLSSREADKLFSNLAAAKEQFEKSSTLLLVMPMNLEDRLALSEAKSLADRHGLQFYYMYPYLAASYINSMHHAIKAHDAPACVLVDVEGRTILSSNGISDWKKNLDLKPILESLY